MKIMSFVLQDDTVKKTLMSLKEDPHIFDRIKSLS